MCLICDAPSDWQHEASCATHRNPDLWFPEEGDEYFYDEAKRVCEGCSVSGYCLEDGIGEKFGMWAGTLPHERAKLAAKLPRDKEQRRKILRQTGFLG